MKKLNLQAEFQMLDAERQEHLREGRANAAMTDWTVLPEQSTTQSSKSPARYQSIAPRGLANLEGLIVLAMLPPGLPWMRQEIPAHIAQDPEVSDDAKKKILATLYRQDMTIMGELENAYMGGVDNGGFDGQTSAFLREVRQLLVTGDTLTLVGEDLRKRLFRNDHYVTRRNASLEILCHITWEKKNLLSLTDEELSKYGFGTKDQLQDQHASSLERDLYTKVEWQPNKKNWVITQELDGKPIGEPIEQKISRYICASTALMPGSSYGRAFMSRLLPEVVSYDGMCEAAFHCAAVCADIKLALDENSNTREVDFNKPPLSIIRTRVRDGKPVDVGVIQGSVGPGYAVIRESQESLRREIARSFLLQDEMVRDSERTTAAEIGALISQLNQSLGGLYTPIADAMLTPLAYIARDILSKKKKIERFVDEDLGPISILTGSAALARRQKMDAIVSLLSLVPNLGPEAAGRINASVALDTFARSLGVNVPGLIKTEEQYAQEQAAAQQARVNEQAAIAANEQAAAAVGGVAQEVAMQQLAPR